MLEPLVNVPTTVTPRIGVSTAQFFPRQSKFGSAPRVLAV
jgi:hypothetical protein